MHGFRGAFRRRSDSVASILRVRGWVKAVVIAGAATLLGIVGLLAVGRPQFDPYGWLLWGREIINWNGFSTADYPSWKPLGALLATPVALTGTAAPAVWLVVERAIALVGVWLAYLLGNRMAGRAGGILAAVGVVLVTGWLGMTLDGHLEPVVATLLLAAFWLDSEHRPVAAFAALTGAALARPEAWLVLLAYGVVMWQRGGRPRIVAVVVIVLVPVLWFGGDVIGSGSAFRGGNLAREAATAVSTNAETSPGLFELGLVAQAPLAALGACAVLAFASRARRRDRLWVFMGAVALSWVAVDVLMAATGYPADPRYVLPEAVVVTVLGAAALVQFARAGLERVRTRPQRVAAAAVVFAALVLSLVPALSSARSDARDAAKYARNVRSLATVTARLRTTIFVRCHPSIEQAYEAPMAWYLHKPVGARPKPDGLALADSSAVWTRLENLMLRERRLGGLKIHRLASAGIWQPEVLEPRRPKQDAKGPLGRACDRRTGRLLSSVSSS